MDINNRIIGLQLLHDLSLCFFNISIDLVLVIQSRRRYNVISASVIERSDGDPPAVGMVV